MNGDAGSGGPVIDQLETNAGLDMNGSPRDRRLRWSPSVVRKTSSLRPCFRRQLLASFSVIDLEVRAELVLGRPAKALESPVQQDRENVLKEIVKRFLFEISKLLQ